MGVHKKCSPSVITFIICQTRMGYCKTTLIKRPNPIYLSWLPKCRYPQTNPLGQIGCFPSLLVHCHPRSQKTATTPIKAGCPKPIRVGLLEGLDFWGEWTGNDREIGWGEWVDRSRLGSVLEPPTWKAAHVLGAEKNTKRMPSMECVRMPERLSLFPSFLGFSVVGLRG